MHKIDVLRIYRQLSSINRAIQSQKDFYLDQYNARLLNIKYQNIINDCNSHNNAFLSIVICEVSVFASIWQFISPISCKIMIVYLSILLTTFIIWIVLRLHDKKRILEISNQINSYYSNNINIIQSAMNYDNLQDMYSEVELLNELISEYIIEYKDDPEKLAKIQELVSNRLQELDEKIKNRSEKNEIYT